MVKKQLLKIKKALNKKNIIKAGIVIAILVVAYLLSETGGLLSRKEEGTFEIEEGMTFSEVTEKLKEEKLINNKLLFKVIAKITKGERLNSIEAGNITLGKKASYRVILDSLCEAERFYNAVTVLIPEGFNLKQIKERLIYYNLIDPAKFDDAVKNHDFDYSFLKELEKKENRLEGYLFPDTYLFTENDDEISIIDKMLSRFEETYRNYEGQIKDSPFSLHETIILASIIEKEGGNAEDYKLVSSVFHNRLKRDDNLAYLQSCATVQYLLDEVKPVLSHADIAIDSLYNTYKYKGLPVGPIASPGESAINAAINPADTNYLYFQNDENGVLHFTDDYNVHLENIKKFQ